MEVSGLLIVSIIFITILKVAITQDPRIVCYYTNWSIYRWDAAQFAPQNINPYLCTHLIYAFGDFNEKYLLKPTDPYQDIYNGGYTQFTGLKKFNKNLKTLLSVGSWSCRFSKLVGDVVKSSTFDLTTVTYLRENNFDGLDLNWITPTFGDGTKPEDRENYAQFIQDLSALFTWEAVTTGRPRLLLTVTIPAVTNKIDQGFDLVKLNQYIDWFNVLSYDYHDSSQLVTHHYAPLYSLGQNFEDSELNIDFSINYLIKVGVDRQKLVLGIATYGRSYTLSSTNANYIGAPIIGPGMAGDLSGEKGFIGYLEICQNINNDNNWIVVQPNETVAGPYMYKDDQWICYDDENIVRKKSQYVAQNGLGGIMFWSLDTDDFRGICTGKPFPLIEAAKESLLNSIEGNPAMKYTTIQPITPGLLPKKEQYTTPKPLESTASPQTTFTFANGMLERNIENVIEEQDEINQPQPETLTMQRISATDPDSLGKRDNVQVNSNSNDTNSKSLTTKNINIYLYHVRNTSLILHL